MKNFLSRFILTRHFGEHVLSAILILMIIAVSKDFMVFFLTTFLCASLFSAASRGLSAGATKIQDRLHPRIRPIVRVIVREKVLITLLYIFFAIICIIAISDIGPALLSDTLSLLREFSEKSDIDIGVSTLTSTLDQWQSISGQISDFVNIVSPSTDSAEIVTQIFRIGGVFFQVLFAYIVSYIWLLEHTSVKKYFAQIKTGPFAFLYRDLSTLFHKITQSFGLVFHAQSKIAIVNTILTVLGLLIIGFFYGQLSLTGNSLFPYLLALACITFLTSFVPILGVFIGGIPIVFAGVTGYPDAGWSIVIVIIMMLFVIHAIEGYFLNPRIVGLSLNIPAPIIFIILFVSEHFMGIAGFFLGVPLYILLLDALKSIGNGIQKIASEDAIGCQK